MKINDLEKLTGLKRSNIFYYEREGLLAPKREENNYREYSEDDLRRLKTIVLRKLGFTVAELWDRGRSLVYLCVSGLARGGVADGADHGAGHGVHGRQRGVSDLRGVHCPAGPHGECGGLAAPDEWELNEFSDVLYLWDDGLRYVWNMICDKDILLLLSADEITPELLLAAARSKGEEKAMGQPFDMESPAAFTATRVWDGLPVPEDLMALAAAVRAEL